jgi:hypothetical protein
MMSTIVTIISCRQIGTKSYILADITNECYNDEHKSYVFGLAVPSLILWGAVFPGMLLYYLLKN